MNVLFVGKRTNNSSSGIEKKMMGQIKALEKIGHRVYYTYFEGGTVYLATVRGDREVVATYKQNIFSMYLANEIAIKNVLKRKPYFFQMFYIRKGMISPYHLGNLIELQRQEIKIVEEIPTYPYDKELLDTPGISLKIYYLCDSIFRKFLRNYVNLIATYSEDELIFGVPTVTLTNGIDVEDIPLSSANVKEGTIRLVTVSAMYYWHGYERLIMGLSQYYNQENCINKMNIHVDMVGDGPCREEWERLVLENNLSEHFTFWGEKSGVELDDIMNNVDIAIASLAIYKKNLDRASELKIREYCARGIPFVVGCKDMGFKQNMFFMHEVPNDASYIDINQLIIFHEKITNCTNYREEMRRYAENNFRWELQMKKVIQKVGCE